jgi:hypothetical protein
MALPYRQKAQNLSFL